MKNDEQFRAPRDSGAYSATVAADAVQQGAMMNAQLMRHWVAILYRFRFRSMTFFLFALSLVVVGFYFWPREYSSEAKLFVRVGRGANVTLDPTVTKGLAATMAAAERNSEIKSALEIMSSRAICEKLIDIVGSDPPHKTPLERDKAISSLSKDLTIWSPPETNVLCASCVGKSPEKAQRTVSELVALFLEEHLRVNSASGSYEFFAAQAEEVQRQLTEEQTRLEETKNQFGLASIEGRRTILEEQIGQIEQFRNQNWNGLLAARAKIDALQGTASDLPDAIVNQIAEGLPEEAANSQRQRLYILQKREQELLLKYADNHPELIVVRKQIRDAQSAFAVENPDRAQATSSFLLAELVSEKGLRAQSDSLDQQLARLHDEVNKLNKQEVQIVDLERNIKILDTKYGSYVENLEQSRIERALERDSITNISVIQPASLELKPTSPKTALTLAGGLMFAALGALALAFLSDQLDPTLRSSRQVELCLQAPVLLTMPRKSRRKLVTK
jgi:uncharacterized protein involved in exopolysaccharide biosynthesis